MDMDIDKEGVQSQSVALDLAFERCDSIWEAIPSFFTQESCASTQNCIFYLFNAHFASSSCSPIDSNKDHLNLLLLQKIILKMLQYMGKNKTESRSKKSIFIGPINDKWFQVHFLKPCIELSCTNSGVAKNFLKWILTNEIVFPELFIQLSVMNNFLQLLSSDLNAAIQSQILTSWELYWTNAMVCWEWLACVLVNFNVLLEHSNIKKAVFGMLRNFLLQFEQDFENNTVHFSMTIQKITSFFFYEVDHKCWELFDLFLSCYSDSEVDINQQIYEDISQELISINPEEDVLIIRNVVQLIAFSIKKNSTAVSHLCKYLCESPKSFSYLLLLACSRDLEIRRNVIEIIATALEIHSSPLSPTIFTESVIYKMLRQLSEEEKHISPKLGYLITLIVTRVDCARVRNEVFSCVCQLLRKGCKVSSNVEHLTSLLLLLVGEFPNKFLDPTYDFLENYILSSSTERSINNSIKLGNGSLFARMCLSPNPVLLRLLSCMLKMKACRDNFDQSKKWDIVWVATDSLGKYTDEIHLQQLEIISCCIDIGSFLELCSHLLNAVTAMTTSPNRSIRDLALNVLQRLSANNANYAKRVGEDLALLSIRSKPVEAAFARMALRSLKG
eukprot:Pgem_evm1s19415